MVCKYIAGVDNIDTVIRLICAKGSDKSQQALVTYTSRSTPAAGALNKILDIVV